MLESRIRIDDAVEEFLVDRQSISCKANTIKFYRTQLGQVVRSLAKHSIEHVDGLTRSSMRIFFAEQSERVQKGEIRRVSVTAYDRSLRAFCRFCVAEGWMDSDPMKARPRLKAPKTMPDTWTFDEVAMLIETCDSSPKGVRDRAIMLLWLDTGLRVGEMVNLTPDDVELEPERGRVLVRAELKGSKSNRDRIVPFWTGTANALRQWLTIRPPEADALFVALSGGRNLSTDRLTSDGFHQIMRRRVKQAGVPKKRHLCHIWRHTFAKQYVEAGGDLETLRRILGHSQLETVMIYLGFSPDDIANKHFQLSPVRQLFNK